MNRTAGTSRLTPEQADEMLARYGARYLHVASGESMYAQRARERELLLAHERGRTRTFGTGRMAPSVKSRKRR